MPAFIDAQGAPVEVFDGLSFVDRDSIQRPSNWLEKATDDELAAAGVHANWPIEPPTPPAGKTHVPTGLTVREGLVARTYRVVDAPPPPAEPVPLEVADWQFASQAAAETIITREEALAWAARGEVPATLDQAVAAAIPDPDALFEVRMLLAGAKSYLRDNPLVPLLGQVFGKDAAGLDQFWRDAAKRGV